MGQVLCMFTGRSMPNEGTPVLDREHPYPSFVVVARALWPRKTAAHLAAGSGVTERAAKFWLSGDREPSPEAFRFLITQIMERRCRGAPPIASSN